MDDLKSSEPGPISQRPRKLWSRVMMVVRRTHLYAGLFLLPWVFLFGVTGAMFNHQGLFPRAKFTAVPAEALAESDLSSMESADMIAQKVVDAISAKADGKTVTLLREGAFEYTGDMLFETWADGSRHVAHISPVTKTAYVSTHPPNENQPKELVGEVKNVSVTPAPMGPAKRAAKSVFEAAGIEAGSIKPIGWTKLNFLVDVDGQPARVTYVLKDGHVDVTSYNGSAGMPLRHFFLRLHTTHVMSPYWNGRTFWVIAADIVAVAMVTWGLSGLMMWWQIKRTRMIGAVAILASVVTATWMYWSVAGFYATTKL